MKDSRLDEETVNAALDRLGISHEQYQTMTHEDFVQLLEDVCWRQAAWRVRWQARSDQLEAAGRVAELVPAGVGLRAAAGQGLISDDEASAAISTLVRVLAEDEQDPPPISLEVRALLTVALRRERSE